MSFTLPSDAAGASVQSQWGVYDANNQPIALADSVYTFDYRNDNRISNFVE